MYNAKKDYGKVFVTNQRFFPSGDFVLQQKVVDFLTITLLADIMKVINLQVCRQKGNPQKGAETWIRLA